MTLDERQSITIVRELDCTPIEERLGLVFRKPSTAELSYEFTTENIRYFSLPPARDIDKDALHRFLAFCNNLPLIDISSKLPKLWNDYESLFKTVTSYGGPKDFHSFLAGMKMGEAFPGVICYEDWDGSLVIVGGRTRIGLAQLGNSPVLGYVMRCEDIGLYIMNEAESKYIDYCENMIGLAEAKKIWKEALGLSPLTKSENDSFEVICCQMMAGVVGRMITGINRFK